jgi:2-iminoacetate synthase ThiH
MQKISTCFYNKIYESSGNLLESATLQAKESTGIVSRILEKRLSSKNSSMNASEVALLLRAIYLGEPEVLGLVDQAAQLLRTRIFGNCIATMAPVEITTHCISDCSFCGWRSSNKDMPRVRLSEAGILEQVQYLCSQGITHIELAGGDDITMLKKLPNICQKIKTFFNERYPGTRLSICFSPLTKKHYASLAASGVDSVFSWQETYHKKTYQNLISKGPKALSLDDNYRLQDSDGYLNRLTAHENVLQNGMQVGIGCMLGMAPNPLADILSVVIHGRELLRHYPDAKPLVIGMPIQNGLTTDEDRWSTIPRPTHFADKFASYAALYLLSFPDHKAWIFPNCRVSFKEQVRAINIAGCFTSTEVKLSPGGYTRNLNSLKNTSKKDLHNKDNVFDTSEQFRHHFQKHQVYLEAFQKDNLRLVSDEYLLERQRG